MKTKNNTGFTLIEVIIYIALFSLLLGTAFITAYELVEGSDNLSIKNTTAAEGSFVVRKLTWALSSAYNIAAPSLNTLTVTKHDGNIINFRLKSNKVEMRESDTGNTFIPITTDNVSVSNLQFTYLSPLGESPAGITTVLVINETTFTITKYLRK